MKNTKNTRAFSGLKNTLRENRKITSSKRVAPPGLGVMLGAVCMAAIGLLLVACPATTSGSGTTTYSYVCENGTSADGDVTTDNITKCAQCNSGFKLHNEQCVATKYTCNNGTPAEGKPSGNVDEARCVGCNDGYIAQGTTDCVQAGQYFCTNGTPRSGNTGSTEAVHECATCFQGYAKRANNQCTIAAYTCTNGTPVSGGPSTGTQDVENCQSCFQGYTKRANNQCTIAVYTCTNGTPVSGGPSTGTQDVENCQSCFQGYTKRANNQCTVAVSCPSFAADVPEQDIEPLIAQFIDCMTLREKVWQMQLAVFSDDPSDWQDSPGYSPGVMHINFFKRNFLVDFTKRSASIQDFISKANTPIPAFVNIDAIHGHAFMFGTTVFPHNVGLGAANNPELTQKLCRATAIEARASGVNHNSAPVLAVAQNIRWGRTYESYSSDPDIVSRLTKACIRGANSVPNFVSVAKHFFADGGTHYGGDRGNAIGNLDAIKAIHLPPYYAAIEASVDSIMISYSSVNDVPMHQNHSFITDLLKGEMGFGGIVLGDWLGIKDTVRANSYQRKLEMAINAGIDQLYEVVDAQGKNDAGNVVNYIIQSVESGAIPMQRIDDAVSRILRVKIKKNIARNPGAHASYQPLIRSQDHLDLARQAVAESLVLLKNSDDTLPFGEDPMSILLVGEHNYRITFQMGGWTVGWNRAHWYGRNLHGLPIPGHSIEEAIRERAGIDATVDLVISQAELDAVDASYDIAIVTIGERPYEEYHGDRRDLIITNNYRNPFELVKAASERADKVVTLVIAGRPRILDNGKTSIYDLSQAIVMGWLPGSEALGISDVLWGDKVFKGTLPFEWPATGTTNYHHGQGPTRWSRGYGLTYD